MPACSGDTLACAALVAGRIAGRQCRKPIDAAQMIAAGPTAKMRPSGQQGWGREAK